LLLVRHSAPEVDPSVRAEEWRLSDEGRRLCVPLAEELARSRPTVLVSSPEPKAIETAELVAPVLGLRFSVDERLRETSRRAVGWLDRRHFERGTRALFDRPDEVAFGEESANAALARFRAAVDGLPEPAVVVSHGTVISLYVAAVTRLDGFEVWRGLAMPDIVEI
jgi:broad specificity phosphatase PhoE